MRKNFIPKDEADDPEEEYVPLDQHIIQRSTIFKAANVHDVNLENPGAREGEAHAKTDNYKLFYLAKTAFGETSLWVHAKPSQRSRSGRQALKLIWYNQLGLHALDKRNIRNYRDIFVLAYNGKKKRNNWQDYVLGHKKCHDVQTALVEQEFNDFTGRKKVIFLLNDIKCDSLDCVISVVSGVSARACFEAAQLMISEHIRMLTEHSKFSSRNFSATYAVCGP